jgi:hypothetical protein
LGHLSVSGESVIDSWRWKEPITEHKWLSGIALKTSRAAFFRLKNNLMAVLRFSPYLISKGEAP